MMQQVSFKLRGNLRTARFLMSVHALVCASGLTAMRADTVGVNGFGSGGWNADDVRDSTGASIHNGSTHAPAPGSTLDEAGVAAQIDWRNATGTWGNLGGVSLTGTSAASGKSTLSVIDTGTGFAATGAALGEDFSAVYRWQNTDTVPAGISFKIGIQSTAWADSQDGFSATRSGEATWDLILVADPTYNPGGNTTTNGQFVTSTVDAATTRFKIFGQVGNTYFTSNPAFAEYLGGSAPSRTLAEWRILDETVFGGVIFGEGSKITNTQFGFGSGNENASGVLDYAAVSYLNSGARIDFVDAARYTGPGSAFGDASNWGGTTPSSSQNLIVDQDATLEVSGTQDTRSLGILAGTTGIVLNSGATLVLNQAENGTLSVDSGAVLGVTGAGTLQAAVIEVGGTLNLATVTQLDGGATAHPVRDGAPSAKSRYGLVVLNGGVANLESGADVTLANNTGVNGFKAMIRVGEVSGAAGPGVLNIHEGAQLTLGSLHGVDSWGALHVGDWGGEGQVNQSGGTVDIFGALMIGNEGGSGTYTITDGALNIYRPVGDNGAIILGRATSDRSSSGTLNVEGGLVTLGAEGGANGNVALVIGGLSDDVAAYANGQGTVNQTGGEVRFEKGAIKFGRGHGTYNLNGGVLAIGGANGISATNNGVYAFNLGGGTLKVIGANLTSGIDFSVVDRDPSGSFTQSFIDTNGFNASLSGKLTGDGALVKTGLGTLTLSGANHLTGQAYVVGGAISQTAGDSIINYLAVGSGSGADGDYSLSGGTLNITQALQVGDWGGTGAFNQTGGTVNVSGSFNVGNQGGTGEYNLSAGTLNLAGGLYSLGRNTDTKPAGSGTFNLSGTGVLDVAGGNFIIGNRDATATAGNGTGVFNQTGGVFRISGTTGADNLFLSGYGDGEYNLLGGVLEIGGNRLRANYGGGGSYVFNFGGGTIKVIGSDLTTSVVPTLVAGTTSVIDTNGLNAVFSGGFAGDGGFSKTNTGSLTLGGVTTLREDSTVQGQLYVGAAGVTTGTLNIESGATLTIESVSGQTGAGSSSRLLVGVGAGKTGYLNINGGNIAVNVASGASSSSILIGRDGGTGVGTMSGGNVTITAATGTYGTFNVGYGAGATGSFTQSGGLVDIGGGAFQIGVVGGKGTYVVEENAEVRLGTGSTIYIGEGAGGNGLVEILDGGRFIHGTESVPGTQLFLGADGGTGKILQSGADSEVSIVTTNPIHIGYTFSGEPAGAVGTYQLDGGTLTLGTTSGNGVRIGESAGATGNFIQNGGVSAFVLNNVYVGQGGTGVFTLNNGTATIGKALVVAQASGSSGTLNLNGGTLEVGGTDGIRKGSGTAAFNLGGGTIKVVGSALTTGMNATLTTGKLLTVDTNNLGAIFSGSLGGAGGLTKTGLGMLRLTGASDYTGATRVADGTLRVDGVLSGTRITVENGGTLSGLGTVADVVIESGGLLAPDGTVPGVFTVTGDLEMEAGSRALLQIAGLAGHDTIQVDGTFFAGGVLEVVFIGGFDAIEGNSFDLFDVGAFEGSFAQVWLPTLSTGLTWDLAGLYDTGVIAVIDSSMIPEPASWPVLAGMLALAAACLRRRGKGERT